ncbi:MAG: hypothetical protein AAFU33_22200 [Bacteroidota bacterium]
MKDSLPEIFAQHLETKENWEREVLAELPERDERRFTLGGGKSTYTHFPARDATPHGEIQRSNRWPNCSFFTHWQSLEGSLSWEIEVLQAGTYQPTIYYTCKPEHVGSTLRLSYNSQFTEAKVVRAFESTLRGQEHDRIPREESYVNDFVPLSFPPIQLPQGKSILTLKAVHIPGSAVADFRTLIMKQL